LKPKDELDLDSAIDWVVRSGIQNADGGFYAWYNCEKERYSFLYPEVTGYAIRLLMELYESMRKDVFLRKAIAAGEWLLKIQRKNGAFHCKYFDGSGKIDKSSYVFDAGICLSGLLNLFEVTSDTKFLKSSLQIADWLLKNQNPDGSFVAGYDPNNMLIEEPHWSATSGCHHLKNLIPLLKLHDIVGDKRCYDSSERLLKWGIGLHSDTGRFYVSRTLKETYSHAHCYAVEGLLKSTKLFDKEVLSEHVIRAAKWLSNVQNEDGSIWNYHYTRKEKIKPSDTLAQALRIWTLAGKYFDVEKNKFEMNIRKGLSFLGKMQCLDGNPRSFGGVYYGKRNGKKIKHVNTWATFFSIQAISFLKERRGNPSAFDALF